MKRFASFILALLLVLCLAPGALASAEPEAAAEEIAAELPVVEMPTAEEPTEDQSIEEPAAEPTAAEPAPEILPDEEPADTAADIPAAEEIPAAAEETASDEPETPVTDGDTASGTCGDNLTWTLDADGVLTISGTGAISDNWYMPTEDDVRTVVIEEGVTEIGLCAFYGWKALTEVTISSTVARIRDSAFRSCTALTDVAILSNSISIETCAFAGCSALTTVTIGTDGDGVTTIGKYAFQECTALTDLTLGSSVTEIGEYAFYRCTSLPQVTVPDSVVSIDKSAFRDCTGLADVHFGSGLTYIGDYAFYNCSSLGDAVIQNGVTEICYATFGDCSSLLSVSLPTTVTRIDDWAFAKCSSLPQVMLPDGVEYIGPGAFNGCAEMYAIYLPLSVETISTLGYFFDNSFHAPKFAPFYGCDNLTVYCRAEAPQDGWDRYWNYYTDSDELPVEYGVLPDEYEYWSTLDRSAECIIIPDTVTCIPTNAFCGCDNLRYVYIPDSVTDIVTRPDEWGRTASSSPFQGCCDSNRDLNLIVCCEAASAQSGWDGGWTFYSSYGTAVLPVSYGVSREEFAYWSTLDKSAESIIIPDYITFIPSHAFSECTDLAWVYIPASVTAISSTEITDNSFNGTGITESPNMQNSPFYGCGTHPVICCEAVQEQSGWDIYWNYSTTLIEMCPVYYGISPEEYDRYETYWTTLDKSAESIVIPDDIAFIPCYAFKDCTGLKEITIPDSVTSIAMQAFAGCTGLPEITVPGSVTEIGEAAFWGCSNLTKVTVSDGVTSIGDTAFAECSRLTEITLPASVTSAGDRAFRYCSGLRDIYIYNPDCELGYICHRTSDERTRDENGVYVFNITEAHLTTTPTIHGYAGSTAETFAKDNDLTFVTIGAEITPTGTAKGDLSGDGAVNIVDALRLFRSVNGQIDAIAAEVGDLNGDGNVNIVDALRLFRYVNGQIETL